MIEQQIQEIAVLFRSLNRVWENARSAWQDEAGRAFERDAMEPLLEIASPLLACLEELDVALRRANDR